jgi:ABC-type glycerol-3-phosphate transport system substrate-binding protein
MNITLRKVAVVGAVAALAAAALTSCSSSTSSDSGPQALNVAYWDYGPAAESGNKSLADGFMKANPKVKVTLTPIAGDNWGGYYANLATLIASGKHPDLTFISSEGVKFLSQNNLVRPINQYLKSDPEGKKIQDNIAPALLKSFAVGDQITAIPNGWNDMVIYYNTDVFKKEGVEPPKAGWTWDDFEATAKQLTKDTNGDGTPDVYGFTWASNEIFPGILPWVANAGGNLVSKDVCKATADSAPVEKAVTYLNNLIKEGVSPAPMPMSDVFTRFQAGQIAMFGAGRWPTATFLPAGFTSFDIQLYPKGDTYQTVTGSAGYPILKSSKNPDLAWKFQKYAASAAVQDSEIGTPTAPRDSIPSLRSTAEKTVKAGIPPANGQLFYDSVDKYPALTPFPAPAKYSEYESTVLRYTQLIFGGDDSVKDGLAGMQKDLSAIVSCN